MSQARKAFTIYRPLSEFKGDSLIIGCGHNKNHHFGFLAKSVNSKALHPSAHFYHISLPAHYSEEGQLDIEGNFLDKEVFDYLAQKQFKLICFEAVTEIFSSHDDRLRALRYAKKLLPADGVCFVYFGGRDMESLDDVISQFKYSYSFTYGAHKAWSMVGSDSPFDLVELISHDHYLKYMANVIKDRSQLEISYNYEESALDKQMMSSNPDDLKLLEVVNPFAKDKLITVTKRLASLVEQTDDDDLKPRSGGYGTHGPAK